MDVRPQATAIPPRWDPPSADSAPVHGRANRLLRTGHLLTASSVATSGLGAGYWVFVARWYSPAEVGRGYAAVSAMMFLAGFGQLNLANTLVRFVPSAGPKTLRLIRRVYLVAAATTTLLATGFVLAVQRLSPQLGFLHTTTSGVAFVLAAACYAVFVIQDGALTGLARADWVLLENAVFAVAKIVFVAVFAAVAAAQGILVSWYAALAVALAVTNWFLFTRAVPSRAALDRPRPPDAVGPTVGYLTADFLGSLCWLVATTLMPLVVLDQLGAASSAYFSLAWMVAYTLYLLSANMGSSLIVEAANDAVGLAANCRRVLRHTGVLLAAGVTVVGAAAPWVLRLFGPGYAANATWLLRLLLLSALPNLVVASAVSVCRARRRVWTAAAVLGSVCATALGVTVLLLPRIGIAGAGYGWLIAQTGMATLLLVRRGWWLGPAPAAAPARPRLGLDVFQAAARRVIWACSWPTDRLAAFRLARAHGAPGSVWRAAPVAFQAIRTHSDLLVVRVRREESLAVKCARTERAHQALTRQHSVLGRLHADGRLGEWRVLLPRIVAASDSATGPRWTVEGWLPGVSGSALLRTRPSAAARMSSAAVEAIEVLHHATGRQEEVGTAHLSRWVDEPLAMVERELRPRLAEAIPGGFDALRETLHARLRGRLLWIGWVHRDFHPGNVLFARDGRRVTGIVDWAGAVPDGPTELDVLLFRLAVRRETESRSFGDLVVESLRADAEDGELGLLLLAWLWHVTDNLEKSTRFMASRLWTGRNVLDVLKAVAQ